MKSFKQYLIEKDDEKDDGRDLAAITNAKAMYDQHNANWHGDMGVASMISTPKPKDRMQGEKTFNSDVGVAFDLTPDGELEGNQAGFKAVADRKKKGFGFSTVYPQFNLKDYRSLTINSNKGQYDGLLYKPQQKSKTCCVFIHGTASNFHDFDGMNMEVGYYMKNFLNNSI
jgi:hypothetical protein